MTVSILLVSNAFYPENSPRSFRTTELAKEFSRQGHQVTVITPWVPEHDEFAKQHNFTIKDMGKIKWPAIAVKGSGLMRLFRRVVSRLANLLFAYPDIQFIPLLNTTLGQEKGYDLLISIAVPHPIHWGVAGAWRQQNPIARVWAADCGDPYMGQENDSFRPPFYFKYVEKWWCRKADYITVPTMGAKEAYYPEFRDKIKVIPQGFRFEDIRVKDEQGHRPYPVFAYAGMFIPGHRDPKEFLTWLVSLEQEFRFHIYTTTPQWIQPFMKAGKGRVVLHAPVPRQELLYELSGMDFMVNFENAGSKQTPSKLIDYAIINKPVLSVKTGNLDKTVVNEFLQGNYSHSLKIDREQYRIEKVAQQFLSLLNN